MADDLEKKILFLLKGIPRFWCACEIITWAASNGIKDLEHLFFFFKARHKEWNELKWSEVWHQCATAALKIKLKPYGVEVCAEKKYIYIAVSAVSKSICLSDWPWRDHLTFINNTLFHVIRTLQLGTSVEYDLVPESPVLLTLLCCDWALVK